MNNLLEDVPILKNLIIHFAADQLSQVFPESNEINEIAMMFLDELKAIDPNTPMGSGVANRQKTDVS